MSIRIFDSFNSKDDITKCVTKFGYAHIFWHKIFSYPHLLACVLGAQKSCLIVTVLLSNHNIYGL